MSGPPPPSVLPPAAAPESAAVPAPNPPSRATSPGSATAATAFRPLNVRDALQYLDRVKQQFATEYQVYDQFLNIMKDFKTQNIDTPGVIDRVSTLFRGHPSLIQGFNTFLPPGYRIECFVSAPNEEGASNTITVTTPMGVTTRTQDVTGVEAREFVRTQPRQQPPAAAVAAAAVQASTPTGTPSPGVAARIIVGSAAVPKSNGSALKDDITPVASSSALPPLPPLPSLPPLPPTLPTTVPKVSPTMYSPPAAIPPYSARSARFSAEANDAADAIVAQTPIMEFNHAINYVNKIKNRFTKDPETYKTFLEILQTYQKETRPIQEVYTQVTALFHSAPDLLDEFKAFLPDTTDQPANGSGVGLTSTLPVSVKKKDSSGAIRKEERPGPSKKGMGGVVEEKKKRAAPGMGERAKAKRAKTHHAMHPESPPPVSASMAPTKSQQNMIHADPIPSSSSYHQQPYGAPPPGFPGAPRMQSAYDSYVANHRTPTLVQADEFGFFDRVKKYLDDRTTYTEFLKLLNLFTQEIIDVATLLEKSLLFIGGSDELVGAFRDLVGWDPVRDGRIVGEDWIIDNEPVLERPKVELHLMKSFGPSYRKLPDSEIDLACSGRDALEWSVLNDEWVAFATWASEGSGAHRKNVYEDALYNSEQERHWYSFQIESNLRTIAHIEPIAARIAQMTPDERAGYRLEDGLGGPSPSVYERVVRKVWGKDHGYEILAALRDNPATAVPIVLSRLKQKDEEWKRAEREWNKVWREVDSKNFYRALDHQAIPFKAADKKVSTTSKSLTTEIETLRREKQQKRFDLDGRPVLRSLHQYELGMPDRDVLFDVLKLCFSFLDRDQSGTSAPERARVEAFLRLFVPLLFGVPHSDMEANLAHSDETPENDEEETESEVEANANASDGEAPSNGSSVDVGVLPKNGLNKKGGAADLRKRLLTHAATAAARGGQPKVGGSPVDEERGSILGEQTWIQLNETSEGEALLDAILPGRRYNFFANSTFYCLVRIFHTLYHRLSSFKQRCAALAAERTQRLSSLAVDLGLSPQVPIIDQGDNPALRYYEHALDLAEKLFDGDVDQTTYEEQLRYMVGIDAYPLFTVDKLIQTVIKHIHTINVDARCQDLVTLLEKDRARDSTTPRQQIAYRMEAESIIGAEENLYRLEWIPESQALTIQLIGKEELTLDDAYGSEEKMHSSWVASFALTSATEGVGAQVKAPLLKRNRILSAAEDPQEFDLTSGLEAKVLDHSYRLLFVANTEDYLHRHRPTGPNPATVDVGVRRQKRFEKWLENASSPEKPAEVVVVVEEVHMEL